MSYAITTDIENNRDSQGLEAARARYRAWFIQTSLYRRYQSAVNSMLTLDGYADCIVTD